MTSLPEADVVAPARGRHVSRSFLYGGLIAVGFANAISGKISAALASGELVAALLNTFDVSVFVWLALAAGLLLVARAAPVAADGLDWGLATLAGVAILVPVPDLSWLAVTGLALVLLLRSMPGSTLRRGAIILLAVTVPSFWARIVMSVFSDAILSTDATLVAWAVGTQREGNLVPFADGSGAMWIAPACSSFTNLSLAILAFVGALNLTSGRLSPAKLGLGALACGLVVLINVTRISLIGYFPADFELLHGPVGSSVAGWLATLAIIAVSWFAVRRDALDLG